MKVYTEDGQLIGTVPDREYKKSRNSVMPMRLKVETPKLYVTSSGFYVMALVGLFGAAAAILSALTVILGRDSAFFTALGNFGVTYHSAMKLYPLLACFQLIVTLVLSHEQNMFLAAAVVRITGLLPVMLMYLQTGNDVMGLYLIFDFIAESLMQVGFMICSGIRKPSMIYCFGGLVMLRLLAFFPAESEPTYVFLQFLIAAYFICEAVWLWYMTSRSERRLRYESV